MSEQAPEPEVIELPPQGDLAFGALMDALSPEPEGEEGGESGGAAAGAAGGDAPAAPDAGGAAGGAGAPGAGAEPGADAPAAGEPPAGGDAGGGAEQPAAPGDADGGLGAGSLDAATIVPRFAELSTALEERTQKGFEQSSLEEVREEYDNYFTALDKHPRLLVGTQVPAIGREGMETLRDTNDAREWQEAVKSILVAEVRDRAGRQMEESSGFLQTVHQSIELFQNNVDLIPGTKGFDRDLADRFAKFAEPYELRVEGKLQGYSIEVQPIVNQLRAQVKAERAAAAPPPAAGATPAAGKKPAKQADPPQAGIQSKAGNGSNTEDFSTLFGTLGLPNLQI